MYKVIGADGQEYGPVSADQIRQWIRENRLNAQSQLQAVGSPEWKPLSAFPEFGHALGAQAALGAAAMGLGGEAAAARVRGPAIGLMVTAILGFVTNGFMLVWNLVAGQTQELPPGLDPELQRLIELFSGTVAVVSCAVGIILSVLVLYGALQMKQLRHYGWAMAASIIALVPCISPCCVVGLPIGIWALIVLLKPEVKAQFS